MYYTIGYIIVVAVWLYIIIFKRKVMFQIVKDIMDNTYVPFGVLMIISAFLSGLVALTWPISIFPLIFSLIYLNNNFNEK